MPATRSSSRLKKASPEKKPVLTVNEQVTTSPVSTVVQLNSKDPSPLPKDIQPNPPLKPDAVSLHQSPKRPITLLLNSSDEEDTCKHTRRIPSSLPKKTTTTKKSTTTTTPSSSLSTTSFHKYQPILHRSQSTALSDECANFFDQSQSGASWRRIPEYLSNPSCDSDEEEKEKESSRVKPVKSASDTLANNTPLVLSQSMTLSSNSKQVSVTTGNNKSPVKPTQPLKSPVKPLNPPAASPMDEPSIIELDSDDDLVFVSHTTTVTSSATSTVTPVKPVTSSVTPVTSSETPAVNVNKTTLQPIKPTPLVQPSKEDIELDDELNYVPLINQQDLDPSLQELSRSSSYSQLDTPQFDFNLVIRGVAKTISIVFTRFMDTLHYCGQVGETQPFVHVAQWVAKQCFMDIQDIVLVYQHKVIDPTCTLLQLETDSCRYPLIEIYTRQEYAAMERKKQAELHAKQQETRTPFIDPVPLESLAQGPERLVIYIRDKSQNVQKLNVKPTTPFSAIAKTYKKLVSLSDKAVIKFKWEGDDCDASDTVEGLGIEEEDIVDVIIKQE